ncbi:MAG: DinB family protein [Vicinamibacterales bacterium]
MPLVSRHSRWCTAFAIAAAFAAGSSALRAQAPPAQAPAAPATLQGDLLKDWEALKDTMMKIGDAMPPDKFGYKPTPEQRSFGEQLMHIATSNIGLMKVIDAKATAPTVNDKATAKADILKALGDSYDFGIAVLKAQTAASVTETVTGPRFLGPSTRARIAYRAMGHAWDEYGVMTTYLRLNGIVPPASRGAM